MGMCAVVAIDAYAIAIGLGGLAALHILLLAVSLRR